MHVGTTYFLAYVVLKWEQYTAIYYEDHDRVFSIFCCQNTSFTKLAGQWVHPSLILDVCFDLFSILNSSLCTGPVKQGDLCSSISLT